MNSLRAKRASVCAVLVALFAIPIAAQCANRGVQGDGVPGVVAGVAASTLWDSDGPGPLAARVAMGHSGLAGTVLTHCLATWDPATGAWADACSGLTALNGQPGGVHALTTLPNGDLVAGGDFAFASGVPANNIARWNGTHWSAMGSGTNALVLALATMPNGDVVAGGYFSSVGGVAASRVARWDGTSWWPLGSGVTGAAPYPAVHALVVLANGDVVAGGQFTAAGGVTANSIARWDGFAWTAMGAGVSVGPTLPATVLDLVPQPNGDVVAGGVFTSAGGIPASGIARWDGVSWSPFGAGVAGGVTDIAATSTGDLIVAGRFTAAGTVAATNVARWNGSAWSALGSGLTGTGPAVEVHTITDLGNGALFAGGTFSRSGTVHVSNVAYWNGTTWLPLGSGFNAAVTDLCTRPNGDVVALGNFTHVPGGVDASRIASWDGTSWSAFGPGLLGHANAVATLANGDVVAGGSFPPTGSTPLARALRWDGVAWTPMDSGLNSPVLAFATLAGGDLVAGGQASLPGGIPATNIARWNGTGWLPVGAADGDVTALLALPNGELVVGGAFTTVDGVAANRIARWNGATWLPLGTGLANTGPATPFVMALAALPNGDIVAGGNFTLAGGSVVDRIARWNGASWAAMGSGLGGASVLVLALTPLPNGDLVVGGTFTTAGGVPAANLARWDGASWSRLGPAPNGTVYAHTMLPNGDLALAGQFTGVGGAVSAYFARLRTTCPARVVALGNGCAGTGGANTLAATTLPWLGATFHSVATGMPANAIVCEVLGLTTTSLPLASVLPQGGPGCTLLVGLDRIELHVPSAGRVEPALAIPDSVALIGRSLHQQVVPIELDASGSILAVTSSNALTITIGSF